MALHFSLLTVSDSEQWSRPACKEQAFSLGKAVLSLWGSGKSPLSGGKAPLSAGGTRVLATFDEKLRDVFTTHRCT